MKFVRYFFKDLFVKAIREKRIVFIMCFSLSITIAISFVLIKGLLIQIGDVHNIEDSKKSYFVVNQCNIEDSRCVFTLDEIEKDNALPEVLGSSDIYIDSLSSELDALTVTSYNTDNLQNMTSLVSGSWFDPGDIENGNMVVVCDVNYINEHFKGYTVGDNISLFGSNFTLCGVSDTSNDSFADCYIPYNAIVRICRNGNNNVCVSSTLSVDFADELTSEQKTELINIANMYTHQTNEIKSRYDLSISGRVLDCILYIGLICIMFAFCITNVINLFRYFSLSNIYEYSILKICGSNNGFIAFLLFLQSLIIVCVSYVIGLILYFVSKPLQNLLGLSAELNGVFYFLMFICIIVAMTLSYLPTIRKISTVSPVDKRLWR